MFSFGEKEKLPAAKILVKYLMVGNCYAEGSWEEVEFNLLNSLNRR